MALKGWGELHAFALVKQFSPGTGRDHPPAEVHSPAHEELKVTWLSPFPKVRMVLVPNSLQARGAADDSNAPTSLLAIKQGTMGTFPLGSATEAT